MKKLKSLKKQLKATSVDWGTFVERARVKPGEINANIVRQALKKQDPIPYKSLESIIRYARELGHCEAVIDENTIRHATCFIPEMSTGTMALLLDNVDEDKIFTQCGVDRTNGSSAKDVFDIIIGGHIMLKRYSAKAILELLKRSSRKDLLHTLYTTWDFSYFSVNELEMISNALIDEDPTLLSYHDENCNIPLHHVCRLRYTDTGIAKAIIYKSLRYNIHDHGGLLVRNKDGVTPCQHLVRSDSYSDSVLTLLSDIFQERILMDENIREIYLFHDALFHRREKIAQLLLHRFPAEIGNISSTGNLPLHIATAQNVDMDLIQQMVCEGKSHFLGKGAW